MWTLLFVLLSMPANSSGTITRLRATSPVVRALIDDAIVRSPIVNRLIEQLQQSDTIVYVELIGTPDIPRARTKLVATSGDVRFLRISINVLVPPMDRLPLLAHELHHATEIALAVDARDDDGVRRLYQRIGTIGVMDRYETAAAAEVERRVRAEQFTRRSR